MKKILIIMLSLLLACSAVFAVEGTDEGASPATGVPGSVNSDDEGGNTQATATVTLDLSGGENSTNYWEIGFSKVPVESATSPTDENLLKSTKLVLSENAMTAEDDEQVYVYWIIKGGQELKISLSAKGALSSDTDSIDWQIKWKDSDSSQQSIGTVDPHEEGDYSAKNVHSRTTDSGGTLTGGDFGSVKLDISTEGFADKKAESYQATLILEIKDATTNE